MYIVFCILENLPDFSETSILDDRTVICKRLLSNLETKVVDLQIFLTGHSKNMKIYFSDS